MDKFEVTAFYAVNSDFLDYHPSCTLRGGLTFTVEANTAHHAAGIVYDMLNADNRPNRYTERSLSKGDMLKVDDMVGTRWLAVRDIGFSPEPEPDMTRFVDDRSEFAGDRYRQPRYDADNLPLREQVRLAYARKSERMTPEQRRDAANAILLLDQAGL